MVQVVLSTLAANLATGVSVNGTISAKFSEAMDPATMVAENFTVYDSATIPVAVPGTVSYDLPTMTAKFAPSMILANDTQYTATLSSLLKQQFLPYLHRR